MGSHLVPKVHGGVRGGGGRRTSCSVSIEVGHSIHEEWYIIVQRLEVT